MIYPWIYPILPVDYDIPPTVYSLLNSYVNYSKSVDEKVKISDLAENGRTLFFDFNYPLSLNIEKANFEILILNHFLMRRIGYETLTAFKIALKVKLNEIMPMYNKMFDALEGWNILQDGESIIRTQDTSNNITTSNTAKDESSNSLSNTTENNIVSDRRHSDTPQGLIPNVQDGKYISDYNYDTDTENGSATTKGTSTTTSTQNGTNIDKGNLTETINRSPHDKIEIYRKFIENRDSVMTMIFRDLDTLFYALI